MMGWSLSQLISLVMMMTFLVANSASTSTSTSPSPKNDITCEEAIVKLMPCQGYLRGSDPPTPSMGCCLACQDIYHAANTTAVRRNLCECFKKAAVENKVDPERARKIPELCNLQDLNIPIDPSVDCSTYVISLDAFENLLEDF